MKYFIALVFVLTNIAAYSHSGGTDSSGCHHDRKRGGYHCHHSDKKLSKKVHSESTKLKVADTGKTKM